MPGVSGTLGKVPLRFTKGAEYHGHRLPHPFYSPQRPLSADAERLLPMRHGEITMILQKSSRPSVLYRLAQSGNRLQQIILY